jgi:hypothetical protein
MALGQHRPVGLADENRRERGFRIGGVRSWSIRLTEGLTRDCVKRTPVTFAASWARTMPANELRSTTARASMPRMAAVANSSSTPKEAEMRGDLQLGVAWPPHREVRLRRSVDFRRPSTPLVPAVSFWIQWKFRLFVLRTSMCKSGT